MDTGQVRSARVGGREVARSVRAGVRRDADVVGFRDRVGAGLDMRVVPEPLVTAVLPLNDEALAVDGGGTGAHRPAGVAVGLAAPSVRITGRNVECVEVRVPPTAAYALLGVAPGELHGAVVGLDDLWGGRAWRLRDQVGSARGWEARLRAVHAFLDVRSPRPWRLDPEVRELAGVTPGALVDGCVATGGVCRRDREEHAFKTAATGARRVEGTRFRPDRPCPRSPTVARTPPPPSVPAAGGIVALVVLGLTVLLWGTVFALVLLAVLAHRAWTLVDHVLTLRRCRGSRPDVLEHGARVTLQGGRVFDLPWRSTTVLAYRMVVRGVPMPTYTLVGADGVVMTFGVAGRPTGVVGASLSARGLLFEAPAEWARLIDGAMVRTHLPPALRTVDGGGTVSFGPVGVNREEVAENGGRTPGPGWRDPGPPPATGSRSARTARGTRRHCPPKGPGR